ncbi:MAG: alpha/beta hydrolase [Calothrix sp. C42_A2020_038]|nr:alpha/beta hydrolase [Calothrix sp. C42_A2020_038]
MTLEFITIPPQNQQTPTHQIIMLHGWGANADDLASLVPYLDLPNYLFIFPNAPFPYPYSPVGRAWYDLSTENMYQGLPESREILTQWILSLEKSTGVALSQTILSGFSQGGAMTLDVGLQLPVAGLVSMSGYLHDRIAVRYQAPTLIMHGIHDRVVPLQAAVKARETIKALGVVVEYHEFDAEHQINMEMLRILRNFILNTLPLS